MGLRIRTVKLPRPLDRRVASAARRRRTSCSQVVREALEAYLDGGRGTVLHLLADLAGVFEGPGDLSANRRHLADYGR